MFSTAAPPCADDYATRLGEAYAGTSTAVPWDEARLRAVLDRWTALPPGPERDRLTRTLLAALRALSPGDARGLTTDIYRAFRARALRERLGRRGQSLE